MAKEFRPLADRLLKTTWRQLSSTPSSDATLPETAYSSWTRLRFLGLVSSAPTVAVVFAIDILDRQQSGLRRMGSAGGER
jgi:hypothetical protein